MPNWITVTIASLALMAASVSAQNRVDAEEKFHEAFVAEVVDGKVAEAARAYAELMADDATPPALRAESRFRFGVCCVLLGRADEARSQFVELLADPALPAGLRAKVEEYRSSIAGVAAGGELSRRLSDLMFEMGGRRLATRGNEPGPGDIYRNFQIIGDDAVPFLVRLLDHPDVLLRQHAFQVLCRMDAPDLAALWDPEVHSEENVLDTFGQYLSRHPRETRTLEEGRLLSLGEPALSMVFALYRAGFSDGFMVELSGREGGAVKVLRILRSGSASPGQVQMIRGWLGDGGERAAGAAALLTSVASRDPWTELDAGAVLPLVVRQLSGRALDWRRSHVHPAMLGMLASAPGLRGLAERAPPEVVLDLLEECVAAGEEAEPGSDLSPLRSGLADNLAMGVASRLDTPDRARILADLFRRWTAATPREPVEFLAKIFVSIFEALPEREDVAFVEAVLPQMGHPRLVYQIWKVEEARDVGILLAMLRATEDSGEDSSLLGCLGLPRNGPDRWTPDTAAAVVEAIPDLCRAVEPRSWTVLTKSFVRVAAGVDGEIIRSALLGLAGLFSDAEKAWAGTFADLFAPMGVSPGPLYLPVCFESLPQVWEILGEEARWALLQRLMKFVGLYRQGLLAMGPEASALGRFLLERQDALRLYGIPLTEFARNPGLFPAEEWLPHTPRQLLTQAWFKEAFPPERADPLCHKLLADPAGMNETTGWFLRVFASPEVQTELFGRLLVEAEGESLELTVGMLSADGSPVDPKAVRVALLRQAAVESPNLSALARLTEIQVRNAPSEELFPMVARLIRSGEREVVLKGIELAKRLGHADLRAPLLELLDSLDADLRGKAKQALDSIQELIRLKREAKLRAAGMATD